VLQDIRIRDLGVIEDAVLQLCPGLTVLSGETGAGKTMVVQGLGLLLGARADSGLVRTGATGAWVEGIFALPPGHPALSRAADAGGEVETGELVLARTVTAEGRSRAVVGGRTAPAGVLGELGELLVAVHGQADQGRLRRPEEHREVLDGYGGAPLASALAAYQRTYAAHKAAVAERDELKTLDRERTREVDALTVALEHISRVNPLDGEDVALRAEDDRLAHVEGLRIAAGRSYGLLAGQGPGGDEGFTAAGVGEALNAARSALSAVIGHDPALAALDARLAECGYLVADLSADLAAYLADLDVDPGRLAWVQDRRAELSALTRRYGDSIDEVLAYGREAAGRLAMLQGADDRLAALSSQIETLGGALAEQAAALTAERRIAGERFGAAVTGELAHLAMGSATVDVAVTPRPAPGPSGVDDVEIRLAANSGVPARSVAKTASGGELSRVMLAIEVVSGATPGAGLPGVPTFVFDEVDAGVGGRAALDVGARLAALARHAQVVVVTHLAQVAAYADRHLVVRKADDGSVTASSVTEVTGTERLQELARMMGGGSSTAGLEHARELLATAAGKARGGSGGAPSEGSRPPAGQTRVTRRAGRSAEVAG
jgi:DNA repair protein RecN (Recombination protein N)